MDWYLGNDDVVVPKDQELSVPDRFLSPESWSNWEITASGSIESPNKCFIGDMNLNSKGIDFNGKGLYGEVEVEPYVDANAQSTSSSACGGSSEESFNQASLPDYQLDEFTGFEQMDDIFLNSLLEDIPGNEDLHKSFSFSPESQCVMVPNDACLTDVISNSQSISSNNLGIGSSKYLKTHAFSPSVSFEKGEMPASHIASHNLEQENSLTVKAPLGKILVPSEQSCINGYGTEATSIEESILKELEMVMAQLPEKTRICFRDAFYRLAKNSKQNLVAKNQSSDHSLESHSPMWTTDGERIRSGKKKRMESKTNTIDRAIANLTFNKMEITVRDFPIVASMKSKHQATEAMEAPKLNFN